MKKGHLLVREAIFKEQVTGRIENRGKGKLGPWIRGGLISCIDWQARRE